jgi:ureidoacrylate peracid hydrolase
MHVPISFSPDFRELPAPYGILGNVKGGSCFVRGTWGADFVEPMKPAAGDIIVQGKSGLCGFESTNLQFLLGQNHIEYVAIAGFLTNCCVESSMRAAYEKGFKVVTLTDCTAATSAAEQVCEGFLPSLAAPTVIFLSVTPCLYTSWLLR